MCIVVRDQYVYFFNSVFHYPCFTWHKLYVDCHKVFKSPTKKVFNTVICLIFSYIWATLFSLLYFSCIHSVHYWWQLCPTWCPGSCRDVRKQPKPTRPLHLLVWLMWTASPSFATPCEEEQHQMSTSSTVTATTWRTSACHDLIFIFEPKVLMTPKICAKVPWLSTLYIRQDTPGLLLIGGVHFTLWGNDICLSALANCLKDHLQMQWTA